MAKQYLLMVDEVGMAKWQGLLGSGVGFLEVEGMNLPNTASYVVLACPVKPPVEMMKAQEQPIVQGPGELVPDQAKPELPPG